MQAEQWIPSSTLTGSYLEGFAFEGVLVDNEKPRGTYWLIENIDKLKVKIPHNEIMDMVRNAPSKDGKKHMPEVFQAIRNNQVSDALHNLENAKYLNNEILDYLYKGRELPPEYIEWLSIYLPYSTSPYVKKARGRKKVDRTEQMEILDVILRDLKSTDSNISVNSALKAASAKMCCSYETVRGDLYYSERYKDYQEAGLYIKLTE